MQKLNWLNSHIGSMDNAIELINRFYWNISIVQIGQNWIVKGGEVSIFETDNKDSVDAFIYGMALAYSVIPEPIVKQLKDFLDLE